MGDLMRIGSSAMSAAYAQLTTTGQNIANANTPGYVRREVVLQEGGEMVGGNWAGRGVDAVAVRRVYDPFLVRESVSNQAAASQDAARAGALGGLESLFADPQAGLGAAFDELTAAFTDLSARPADPSARAAVLARVDAFANRAATLERRMIELRDSAQGRMQNDVSRANDMLVSLASLNKRITDAAGNGGQPNALLDQRDRILGELNGVIRANATFANDGSVTISTQRGEPLVVGARAQRLQLASDPLDGSRLQVTVQRTNGTSLRLDPAEIGGSLGGLNRFVASDLESARAQVGRLTAAVAGALNARQARGIDAEGRAGAPLMAVGSPTVTGAVGNAGDARLAVSVTDPAALQATDYAIEFKDGAYTLTRLTTGETVASPGFTGTPPALEVGGLRLEMSGTPVSGDRFLVRGATGFAAGARALQVDPSRIAAALPVVAEAGAANGGDVRAASLDVETVGPRTRETVTLTFIAPDQVQVSGPGVGGTTTLPYAPGMTLGYNGWTAALQGTPKAGDTLTFRGTPDAAADNRNALALQALGEAAFVEGAGLVDRYAELVGDVGTRSQSAQATRDMSQRLYEDAERARSEMSGVNLDEEAARLLQYQQAYQAAAKVLATANEMFRSLLDAAG